jgi:hypothetical protein
VVSISAPNAAAGGVGAVERRPPVEVQEVHDLTMAHSRGADEPVEQIAGRTTGDEPGATRPPGSIAHIRDSTRAVAAFPLVTARVPGAPDGSVTPDLLIRGQLVASAVGISTESQIGCQFATSW